MRNFPAAFVALLSLLLAACSDNSTVDRDEKSSPQSVAEKDRDGGNEKEAEESELTPEPEEIGEDCVGFLRATKVVAPNNETKNCPDCPAGTATYEVLKFNSFKIEKISPTKPGCAVTVEIRAEFNPSPGGNIVGGLTGWIPPEKREQYARGQTPAGEQVYKVHVVYTRADGFWRAIEFDQAGQQ